MTQAGRQVRRVGQDEFERPDDVRGDAEQPLALAQRLAYRRNSAYSRYRRPP
jgi:hypothetical protein